MTIQILLARTIVTAAILATGAAVYAQTKNSITTLLPNLCKEWKVSATSTTTPAADLRAYLTQERQGVEQLKDPFTPLARMTCAQRAAKDPPERVVWEDKEFMALVDFGDHGSTLLLTPIKHVNFLTDLPRDQVARLNRLAAATCDALVLAAGEQVRLKPPSCRMYVNPPRALSVSQLHVHVEAHTGVTPPVDNAFLRRTAMHLRALVPGEGCF